MEKCWLNQTVQRRRSPQQNRVKAVAFDVERCPEEMIAARPRKSMTSNIML
jgi:hypothetical protein